MSKGRKIDIRPYVLLLLIVTGVFRSNINSWWGFVLGETDRNDYEHLSELTAVSSVDALDIPEPLLFKKINVNTADRELLQTIKGVGPSLADAIVSRREQSGRFHSGEDLQKIKGVGEKKAVYLSQQLRFE